MDVHRNLVEITHAETSPVQREEFRKWLDHHNNGCHIFAQVSRTAYESGPSEVERPAGWYPDYVSMPARTDVRRTGGSRSRANVKATGTATSWPRTARMGEG